MRPSRQRLAAVVAALMLLFTMMLVSRDFGATWDERFQQKYGEQIWDYAHGRLARETFDTDFGNQYMYGGLIELIAAAAQHAIRADLYVVRHVVNSIFGWLGIVFAGVLAARLFGRRAGWLAAIFLVASPRFFGDSMNNPKDVPFASLSLMALYFTLTADWRPPHLTRARWIWLTVVIALGINVRPLGLVLLVYAVGIVGLMALCSLVFEAPWPPTLERSRAFAATMGRLALVVLVAIPAGTLFWPWAQASPFVRPLEAFLITTRLDWARGFDVLYAGVDMGAGNVPWTYVPMWLLMTTPAVVLIGLATCWWAVRRDVGAAIGVAGLAAFALAPVVAAVVRHATIYDGIRHLEFIVPPLTVLGAAGWSQLLSRRTRVWRWSAAALLAVGIAEPIVFQLRNHPNQIVYFSLLTGGPRAAYARYDMDYWGNCVLQSVQWSARTAERSGVPLVVSGNPYQVVEADAARYRSIMPVPPNSRDYQLNIRLMRGPRAALLDFAARPDIIHAVRTADGTPLCVIIPGPAYLNVSDQLVWDPADR